MGSKIRKAQVVVVAIDQESQSFRFLLLQTNLKRGSFWQNVTGKIEKGEDFEEGALREVIEETGLEIESIVEMKNLNLKYTFTDARERDVHEECFLLVLDKMWEIQIDPHEHQDFKWVGLNDISPDSVKYETNFEPLLKAQNLLKHWGHS